MELTCATLRIEDGIATVELAATGKANRMGPEYWSQLPQLFDQLDEDPAVRAIVLHGANGHFSYGLDLASMAGMLAELTDPAGGAKARTELYGWIAKLQRTHNRVAQCRKPVIAAVSGWCIGGGIDLITACDIRLASADAKFSVREVKLSIVADVGTLARLPAIVGQGVARELALTGDDFDAAKAQRIGLVNEVYASPETLLTEAKAMAGRIAKNAPLTVQGIKRVLNFTSERDAALSLDAVQLWNSAFLPSKDLLESLAAMIEKREPRYTGE